MGAAVAEIDLSKRFHVECADGIEFMRRLPDNAVQMTFGSPPYSDARLYLEDGQNLGISRDCLEWVEWMLEFTAEAHRITIGPVFWVAAGVTRDRCYWPACEGLMWEWWKRGGDCQLYRPGAYYRAGIPGSGGDDYFRQDWEYVMCFKKSGQLPHTNNTACGEPCKYGPGGDPSNRTRNGTRVNGSRKEVAPRSGNIAGGERGKRGEIQYYTPPSLANPGTVCQENYSARQVAEIIDAYESGDFQYHNVGGGKLGSRIAHENEAPFPETLPLRYILSFSEPGDLIFDPFSGSGSTATVAINHNRRFIGCDIRQSQVDLTKRRCAHYQRSLFD